jgi:glutathione-specific gamma-glutamylcyclotransferase
MAAGENDGIGFGDQRITRDGLRDGSLLRAARAQAAPAFPILTDQEIAASLKASISTRPVAASVWVFAYGSLMWNPALAFVEQRIALLDGWHRRFCLSTGGRGSPERPGAMLALDRGGSCQGIAFRLEESAVDEELHALWNREMLTGAYHAHWLPAKTGEGPITVLAFVANHGHPRFVGTISEQEIAERLAFASVPLGTNLAYFLSTVEALQQHGLQDAEIERIHLRVETILAASAAP